MKAFFPVPFTERNPPDDWEGVVWDEILGFGFAGMVRLNDVSPPIVIMYHPTGACEFQYWLEARNVKKIATTKSK